MSKKQIKVIIADDHPSLRIGIRAILERSPDIAVIGEASDGKEAVQMVQELSPDLLILDLQMPVMDGIEALEILNRENDDIIILVLSAYNDSFTISEVLSKGAAGYYLKEEAPEKIVEAVQRAVREKGND